MIKFTPELNNHLVDFAARRSEQAGIKGKKAMQMQHDIFAAATTAIDFINGEYQKGKDGRSCVTPHVWVSILRGELIKKQEAGNEK